MQALKLKDQPLIRPFVIDTLFVFLSWYCKWILTWNYGINYMNQCIINSQCSHIENSKNTIFEGLMEDWQCQISSLVKYSRNKNRFYMCIQRQRDLYFNCCNNTTIQSIYYKVQRTLLMNVPMQNYSLTYNHLTKMLFMKHRWF